MQLPGPLSNSSLKKIKKSASQKNSYISGNEPFCPPPKKKKNFIKPFYTLNNRMLEQPYYLMAAQASNFLIHPYSQTQSFRTALTPSKNIFSKLFSQKLHFQNRSQK